MLYVAPDDVELESGRRDAWVVGVRPMFEFFETDESWACAAHWSPEKGWG